MKPKHAHKHTTNHLNHCPCADSPVLYVGDFVHLDDPVETRHSKPQQPQAREDGGAQGEARGAVATAPATLITLYVCVSV